MLGLARYTSLTQLLLVDEYKVLRAAEVLAGPGQRHIPLHQTAAADRGAKADVEAGLGQKTRPGPDQKPRRETSTLLMLLE